MSLIIDLPPDKAQQLREAAARAGPTAEEFARRALEDRISGPASASTNQERWITGEEYVAEWQRLRAAGSLPRSPQYLALRDRIQRRDDFIWEKFGKLLLEKHPGKWAAIHLSGETIIEAKQVDALRKGKERFGTGGFCLRKLSDPLGDTLYSPRTSG